MRDKPIRRNRRGVSETCVSGVRACLLSGQLSVQSTFRTCSVRVWAVTLWLLMTLLTFNCMISVHAQPYLTGDSMGVIYFFPDLGTIFSPGQVFTAPTNFNYNVNGTNLNYTLNITTNQIIVSDFQFLNTPPGTSLTFSDASFSGLVFTNYSANFATVSVDPATTLAGFNNARVTLQGNILELNFQGLTYIDGESTVVLDVSVQQTTGVVLNYSISGTHLTLYWEPSIIGYVLESSSQLSPSHWMPVPGVVSNSVALGAVQGVQFFRLVATP